MVWIVCFYVHVLVAWQLPSHLMEGRAWPCTPVRSCLALLQVRYTRCNNNPSQVVLGEKIAELEGKK